MAWQGDAETTPSRLPHSTLEMEGENQPDVILSPEVFRVLDFGDDKQDDDLLLPPPRPKKQMSFLIVVSCCDSSRERVSFIGLLSLFLW